MPLHAPARSSTLCVLSGTHGSVSVTCSATSQSLTHFLLAGHGRGPSLGHLHSPLQLPELETLGSVKDSVRLWDLILGLTKPLSLKADSICPVEALR